MPDPIYSDPPGTPYHATPPGARESPSMHTPGGGQNVSLRLFLGNTAPLVAADIPPHRAAAISAALLDMQRQRGATPARGQDQTPDQVTWSRMDPLEYVIMAGLDALGHTPKGYQSPTRAQSHLTHVGSSGTGGGQISVDMLGGGRARMESPGMKPLRMDLEDSAPALPSTGTLGVAAAGHAKTAPNALPSPGGDFGAPPENPRGGCWSMFARR